MMEGFLVLDITLIRSTPDLRPQPRLHNAHTCNNAPRSPLLVVNVYEYTSCMNPTPTLTLSNTPPVDPKAPGTRRTSSASQVDIAVKRSVWHRDGYVCRFCSFHAMRYLEVIVLGGNARDLDHMLTACQFCHQCLNLSEVAAMRSGVLVWLPELGQCDLHHVAREIYLARIVQHSGPRATKVLTKLVTRRELARERLGTDDPKVLALRLASKDPAQVPKLESEALGGIRLLPLDRRILRTDDLEYNQFPQVLAYWRSADGPYHGESEFPWITAVEQMLAAVEGSTGISALLAAGTCPKPVCNYAGLGARRLRDAAECFYDVAKQNGNRVGQLRVNAQTCLLVADLLEQEPFKDLGLDISLSPNGGHVLTLAGKLLEDAANFFDAVGLHNSILADQMSSDAKAYRDLAHSVRRDPHSDLDDGA